MRFLFLLIGISLLVGESAIATSRDTVFNVRDFGATGNRADDATAAIKKAIEAARSQDGGTILIPKGEHTARSFALYSNMTLQVEAGAILYLDLANPAFKAPSFIYAEGAHDITISGKGRIDGQAMYVYEDVRGEEPAIREEMALARAAGVEMKRYYRKDDKGAYNLLLRDCHRVTIEDVTFQNSSLWCMRIQGCSDIGIRGVTVLSSLEKGVNSDGIDIDGSRNVHIYGCTIITGDDAICVKTSVSRRNGKIVVNTAENITIDNCILSSSSSALKLGTESHGDMRHIVFTDCIIRNSNKGIEINVQDGAHVSDIIFANLTMELKRRHWNWWGSAQPFNFLLKKRTDTSRAGSIENVQVSNVIAHAQGTSRILADPDNPVRNFTISNMKVFMEAESTADKRTSDAFYFRNVEQVKLKDIEVCWDSTKAEAKWQSSFVLEHVTGFELQGLSAREALPGSGNPAVLLRNCRDGIIFNCFAQRRAGLFFQIEGERTGNLVFGKNFTENAGKAFTIGTTVQKRTVSGL